MPVRYDIAAQVPQASGGIDALNMMAALRQQEYQDAQLAALQQRGVYQDQQAQMAAMREARQAQEAQARQGQVELDTRLKNLEHLRQLSPLVTPQNYPAFVSEVTGRFPEMKPLFPAAYDPETMQKFSLSAEKFYTQFGPREVDTVVNGVPGKIQQRYDLASKSYVPIQGSFAPSKPDVMYDEKTGTLIDKTAGTARPVMMGGAPASAPAAAAPAGMPAAPPAAGFNMDAAKAGISKVESGGNYSALGPETKKGDRAYGKYQVMGANVPAWTKQALGQSLTPEQFLKSPQAQEAVFEDQFRRNVAKYGTVQDAASVWFSGRPMAKAGNARDVLGTTVPAYVNKFMAGYQGGVKNAMVQPMTGEAPSLRNVPVDAFAAPAMPPAPIMPMAPQPTRPQTLADYAAAQGDNTAGNESQGKAYQYGRMAIDAIGTLANPTYYDALRSRKEQLANKIPYISTPWTSPDYRSADAAASEVTDAVLRQKSGATIHDPEIQAEIKRMVPQPGDTNQQVQDKIARQKAWIEGFIKSAKPSDRKELQRLYDEALKKAGSLPVGVRSIEEVR